MIGPKRKRPPPKTKWKPNFPCGHRKRKADCATCVSLRRPVPRPLADRFWEKVDKRGPDECWPWLGSKNEYGRGMIARDGKLDRAPRVAWLLHHGEALPAKVHACHTCDHPWCVNPAHIFAGSASDNQRDKVAKGRGVYGGRGKTLTDDERSQVAVRFQEGASVNQIAKDMGTSRRTITRLLEIAGLYTKRAA